MITDVKIGITGIPGSGKTYTLLRVLEMLQDTEYKIGGMVNEPIVDGRHKEALQLMLYLLAAQETGPQSGWSGEIIPLQHPEQSLRLQIGNRTVFNADDFESFAAIISDLLAEMANPERSFEAKPDAHCTFCDYSGFCPEGANRT